MFAAVELGAGAEESLEGDRGVADVGGIGDLIAFDAAALALLAVDPPAAALAPAAVGILGLGEPGEALGDLVAERLRRRELGGFLRLGGLGGIGRRGGFDRFGRFDRRRGFRGFGDGSRHRLGVEETEGEDEARREGQDLEFHDVSGFTEGRKSRIHETRHRGRGFSW